ncbi:DUF2165 domain-containing protein [Campylobacter jejuni]|nr:DUF2165 domain-containing protein [Campylobacter jejuni]
MVMSMDTKPDYLGNAIVYRAITSPVIHHIGYIYKTALQIKVI